MGSIQCLALILGVAVVALGGASEADRKADAIQHARGLLSRQLGVDDARVVVQSAEPAEWPDASLGCPEKGMQYAQVITSGYRVSLAVADRAFVVHVAGTHAVVCPPAGAAAKPGTGARAAEVGRVSASARRDLTSRLGLTPAEVKVTVVRDSPGKDAAGCTAPEADDTVGEAPGQAYEVEVRAQGRTYRYLARRDRVSLLRARFVEEPAGEKGNTPPAGRLPARAAA